MLKRPSVGGDRDTFVRKNGALNHVFRYSRCIRAKKCGPEPCLKMSWAHSWGNNLALNHVLRFDGRIRRGKIGSGPCFEMLWADSWKKMIPWTMFS